MNKPESPTSSPLDYSVAPPQPARFSIRVFIASAIVFWGTLAVLALIVPKFKAIFQSFNMKLPATTQLLLSLSDLVIHAWGWIGLVILPFALALMLSGVPISNRWLRLSLTLFVTLLLLVCILTLFWPMMTLVEGISRSAK